MLLRESSDSDPNIAIRRSLSNSASIAAFNSFSVFILEIEEIRRGAITVARLGLGR